MASLLLALALLTCAPVAAQDAATVDSLERVLRAAQTDTARASMLGALSEQFRFTDPDRAAAYARRSIAAAERSGISLYRARALSRLADATWDLGEALALIERGRDAAREAPESADRVRILAQFDHASSGLYGMQGGNARAITYARRAAEAFGRLGDHVREGHALYNLAVLYQMSGDPARALDLHRQIDDIAERIESRKRSRRLIAANAIARGAVFRDVGDPARAAEDYLHALRIAEADGERQTAASALLELHALHLEQGDLERARSYARRAREEYGALGDKATELRMMTAEAETHLRAGNAQRAEAAYEEVVDVARSEGQGSAETEALLGLGRALMERGRPREAAAHLEQGVRQARAGEFQDVLPELLTALSAAERQTGVPTRAMEHARLAVHASEEAGDLRHLSEARAALADALAAHGDHRAAYDERLRYEALRDSLLGQEQAEALADAEVRYDVERHARAAEAERQRAELAELRMDRQRLLLAAAAIGLALLLTLAAALWRAARVRRQANTLLAAKNGEVEAALERTSRLLGEREVLLREVHHRVKNNLQVVASLVHLHARTLDDPAALAALRQMRGRVEAMALVHRRLYGEGDLRTVRAPAYLGELVDLLAGTYAAGKGWVEAEAEVAPVALGVDAAVPLGLAVAELVANAYEHAFPDGRGGAVRVALGRTSEAASGDGVPAERLRLVVEDDGVGLPEGLTPPAHGLTRAQTGLGPGPPARGVV